MRALIAAMAVGSLVGGLELQVEPLKPAYAPGESVVVRVLVRNPPDSHRTWYLKRSFWLVPSSAPASGDLALSIEIVGPDGRSLPQTRDWSVVVRMRTEPCMFAPLHPGEVFGAEVPLDGGGLGYTMDDPGPYEVRATLTPAKPREWFEDWLAQSRRSDLSATVAKHLFADTLHGTATVHVVEPAAGQRDVAPAASPSGTR